MQSFLNICKINDIILHIATRLLGPLRSCFSEFKHLWAKEFMAVCAQLSAASVLLKSNCNLATGDHFLHMLLYRFASVPS